MNLGTLFSNKFMSNLFGKLDPTEMSDVDATRLGLKTYQHGDNGLAITNNATVPTLLSNFLIPYQMQDGLWRLRFNIEHGHTNTGNHTVTISGISFANNQEVSISGDSSSLGLRAQTIDGTGNISIDPESVTSVTRLSGDVPLGGKPAWAY